MYTSEALLDMHTRSHWSFAGLLTHCAQFSADELYRRVPGFGIPSIHLQICHTIDAEDFWLSVVRGAEQDWQSPEKFPHIPAMEQFRARVQGETATYLRSVDAVELSTRRAMKVDDGIEQLVPAHVVLRTLTHIYHHQAQIMAICRLLERPVAEGLDFPLD